MKNIEHIVNLLKQHTIANENILVYFNVSSLFTNIPVEETLQIIQQRLVPQELPEHLVEKARLCLTTSYFDWNGNFHEQK